MTQRPSLLTPISYYAIVLSFALIMLANALMVGLLHAMAFDGASAYWLSHMTQ